MYRLKTSQWLPLSLEEAWDFFSSPANLSKITPAEMRFQILEGTEKKTYAGQIIRYTVRPLLGIPIGWTTEITHCVDHQYFVDEQRFGPYKLWHDQHHFIEQDGGVMMEDDLHYDLYGGPFAALINALIVAPKVKAIFAYREQKLNEIFSIRQGASTSQ